MQRRRILMQLSIPSAQTGRFAEEDAAAEDEAAGLSSATLKKFSERKVTKEQKEIQERRLAKLKELREEQAKRLAASSDTNGDKKLDFLMQQAEVFTHFMGAGADKGSPLKGKGPAAAAKGGKRGRHAVSAEQEDQELVEEAMAQTTGGKVLAQPRNITATLREYQMEGLNWMVNLHDNNISGILADEMGLGKTLQSITLLAYLRETRGVTGPHLVLVPKSVLGNWYREFTKWCPTIKALKCFGQDKESRLKMIKEELLGGDWDVVITTFETVCKERSAFKKFPWYYVVIDEAHRYVPDIHPSRATTRTHLHLHSPNDTHAHAASKMRTASCLRRSGSWTRLTDFF